MHEQSEHHHCCGTQGSTQTDGGQPVQTQDAPVVDASYTCPMHPKVHQPGPGTCPICGMALEPARVTAVEDSSELHDMQRRFWISAALTLPLLLLMGSPAAAMRLAWLQALLASAVVVGAGWPLWERAWASFRHGHLNMFSLIGLGTGAAWAFSLLALLLGAPASLYFEPAAVIVTLVLLGQVLELRARSRTTSAIRQLLSLAPDTAVRVEEDGTEREMSVNHVHVGNRLRIKPGSKVPVDGIVLEGYSSIDESMISGEPMPVEKSAGSPVIAGTINQSGSFIMRAQKIGADTLLSRIVQMVNEAARSRAPIQQLADTISAWFVPAVVLVAVGTFAVWTAVGPAPTLAHAFVAAVSVLIVACPCALGLATPISITVAVGRGAQRGLLVKSAAALERMAEVDTLVIDKTGTLTQGRPALQRVVAADGFSPDAVLAYASALETMSEHPMAKAIATDAVRRQLPSYRVVGFRSIAGQGVQGNVEGHSVAVGNAALMGAAGAGAAAIQDAERARVAGESALHVTIDGRFAGFIVVADAIKPSSAAAVKALKAAGIHLVVLSGDDPATVTAVSRQLDLDDAHGGVSPEQKHRQVQALQRQGHVVAMAGDGINDSPALAQADVGIAMGTGTDIAMRSAQIVLVSGDLNGIAQARELSRLTVRNIRQNLFFAFVYNIVGIGIAAGLLYPAFGIVLSPMISGAAMSLSSVSVIANALRLRLSH
jgi:heavy metal translocating P-type ATPase